MINIILGDEDADGKLSIRSDGVSEVPPAEQSRPVMRPTHIERMNPNENVPERPGTGEEIEA